MFHLNLNAGRSHEALGETFSHVHGPVLSTAAAERHLQVVAAFRDKHVNRLAHLHLCGVEETVDLNLVPPARPSSVQEH